MTTFEWKRKVGQKVSKETSVAFSDNAEDDSQKDQNSDFDWLGNFKKRKLDLQEDCNRKSNRLKTEGEILAENGRYWEAIKKWDEAIQLTPANEKLYEMKAQVLMQLNEIFPAVQAAETAVSCNCRWWVAYQTLGRAQLGIGELELAIQNFSKAIHLNPAQTELWEDDLNWTRTLITQKSNIESKNSDSAKNVDENERTKRET